MLHRGFTIIEMLVVIGILALLMGLTIGGIAAMGKTDRLLVTEHLVGNVIRQARHTARTSGSPVLVSIRTDAQGRGMVSGISRVPIWSEGFEAGTWLCSPQVGGATGHGYRVSMPTLARPPYQPLDKRTKIVRGRKADGFYLSCQVLPPLITNSASGAGATIPLILIGPDATMAASICGLALQTTVRNEQDVSISFQQDPTNATVTFPLIPRMTTWEIVGWINDTTAGTLVEVSSTDPNDRPADVNRDTDVLHASVPAEFDIAWPMAGGRWEEIGLLFDAEGQRLVLYRNGVRVGERYLAADPVLPDGAETVLVGHIEIGPTTSPVIHYASADNVAIDDVAVHRLATSDPVRFPGDIKPDVPYGIIAHPDGRVETNYAAVAASAATSSNPGQILSAPAQLEFSGTFSSALKARLTVSIDGRVDGKLLP